MKQSIRPARTKNFKHTVNGLLTKRAQLFLEAQRASDSMELKNDIAAIDRVLGLLGCGGDLDAIMPLRREAVYGRGELGRAILDVLRTANAPMTTRAISRAILVTKGPEPERKMLTEHTRRVSKALRILREQGRVAQQTVLGRISWTLQKDQRKLG